MNSGMVRIRQKPKYRTAFIGRGRKLRFRVYFGALSLMAGLGIIIISFVRNL